MPQPTGSAPSRILPESIALFAGRMFGE